MTRSNAILAAASFALALGAGGAASAAQSVFMPGPEASQLVQQASPALDLRRGPAAPAALGLGQPELGVRAEVLAYAGASSAGEIRLRLSDAFYRQGLVISPGPSGAAEGEGAPGLVDMAGLRRLIGTPARACLFACVGRTGVGEWLEAAARPEL